MILHINAVEANDVPSMDLITKSDPYLVFKSNKTKEVWKTKSIKNTDTPVWNEKIKIPITASMDDTITAELWDQDGITHDDLISTLVFIVKYLPVGKDTDIWYNFNPAEGVKKGGKVRLVLHLDKQKN